MHNSDSNFVFTNPRFAILFDFSENILKEFIIRHQRFTPPPPHPPTSLWAVSAKYQQARSALETTSQDLFSDQFKRKLLDDYLLKVSSLSQNWTVFKRAHENLKVVKNEGPFVKYEEWLHRDWINCTIPSAVQKYSFQSPTIQVRTTLLQMRLINAFWDQLNILPHATLLYLLLSSPYQHYHHHDGQHHHDHNAQMPHHHDWHHEGHKGCNYTFTSLGGLWDCKTSPWL